MSMHSTKRLLAMTIAALVLSATAFASTGAAKSTAKTGNPLTILTATGVSTSVYTPFPAIFETAKIYADWVNAHGGIKDANGVGHKLKVITCDTHYIASSAQACAREAVAKKVTAYVGGFVITGDQLVPVLGAAHIAYFGACCTVGGSEVTASNSFPLGGGNAIYQVGVAAAAAKYCKSVGLISADTAYKSYYDALYRTAMKGWGKTITAEAYVPLAGGDYSPQVAQVTKNTDCLIDPMAEDQSISILSAMKQLGAHQRLIGIQGNLDTKACSNFKDLCQNAIIVGEYPDLVSPVWKDYRAALAQFHADTSLDYNSLAGLGQWTAMVGFANVVSKMKGTITAPKFLNTVSHAKQVFTGGILPTINFTKPWTKSNGTPRIFNRYVVYSLYQNGKMVPQKGFYNMTGPYFGLKGGF